jgi:prepilin-type N-terminal cleavage/methylation domain-containing protein
VHKSRNQDGFTLIEVTIAGVILVVILTAVLSAWDLGLSAFETAQAQACVNRELRRGLHAVVTDITEANAATLTIPADDMWYETFSFEKPTAVWGGVAVGSGAVITYGLGGSTNDQLVRKSPGETRILANDVAAFKVRRSSADERVLEIVINTVKQAHLAPDVDGNLLLVVTVRN